MSNFSRSQQASAHTSRKHKRLKVEEFLQDRMDQTPDRPRHLSRLSAESTYAQAFNKAHGESVVKIASLRKNFHKNELMKHKPRTCSEKDKEKIKDIIANQKNYYRNHTEAKGWSWKKSEAHKYGNFHPATFLHQAAVVYQELSSRPLSCNNAQLAAEMILISRGMGIPDQYVLLLLEHHTFRCQDYLRANGKKEYRLFFNYAAANSLMLTASDAEKAFHFLGKRESGNKLGRLQQAYLDEARLQANNTLEADGLETGCEELVCTLHEDGKPYPSDVLINMLTLLKRGIFTTKSLQAAADEHQRNPDRVAPPHACFHIATVARAELALLLLAREETKSDCIYSQISERDVERRILQIQQRRPHYFHAAKIVLLPGPVWISPFTKADQQSVLSETHPETTPEVMVDYLGGLSKSDASGTDFDDDIDNEEGADSEPQDEDYA